MKVVDLFCGCGGLTQGFENAEMEVVAAYDNWPDAVACYNLNFAHSATHADLSDVDTISEEIKAIHPNIIVGGPPCQDFSQAGLRKEGDRANLTDCFSRIIECVRPTWFFMENVDRAQHSNAYRRARENWKRAGYGLTEEVLIASFFGVPQKRRRFVCIGRLGEIDGFLSEHLLEVKQNQQTTVREYFNSVGYSPDISHYYRHPRNYSRRAIFSLDEPAPTIRGVNRPVPGGYKGHPGDTQSAKLVRPLTSAERALIQTFPPDFHFSGSKTTVEQMLGNAVPVLLSEVVGSAILWHELQCGRKNKTSKLAKNIC